MARAAAARDLEPHRPPRRRRDRVGGLLGGPPARDRPVRRRRRRASRRGLRDRPRGRAAARLDRPGGRRAGRRSRHVARQRPPARAGARPRVRHAGAPVRSGRPGELASVPRAGRGPARRPADVPLRAHGLLGGWRGAGRRSAGRCRPRRRAASGNPSRAARRRRPRAVRDRDLADQPPSACGQAPAGRSGPPRGGVSRAGRLVRPGIGPRRTARDRALATDGALAARAGRARRTDGLESRGGIARHAVLARRRRPLDDARDVEAREGSGGAGLQPGRAGGAGLQPCRDGAGQA